MKEEKELKDERDRILNDKHMIQEEKEKLLSEMKLKETEITSSKDAQEKLSGRIQALESKLLCGGELHSNYLC